MSEEEINTQKFFRLSNPLAWGTIITVILLGMIFSLGVTEICESNHDVPQKCMSKFKRFWQSPPNEIGDTLAGIAGALAFLWIIVTVLLQAQELAAQREELKLTRKEYEKMSFENTFFSILKTHGEIVNSIELVKVIPNSNDFDTGKEIPGTGMTLTTTGRDCFKVFYNRFTKIYRRAIGTESRKLDYSYSTFWKEHQSELGHYFRFLYRGFKLLSENENAQEYHVKLLRSQLSDQELLLLLYNCISENGEKFKLLAENFALFDNMPAYMLLDESHHKLVSKKAFGNNLMQRPKKQIKPKEVTS